MRGRVTGPIIREARIPDKLTNAQIDALITQHQKAMRYLAQKMNYPQVEDSEETICPDCNGTEVVETTISYRQCQRCKGTGIVEVE